MNPSAAAALTSVLMPSGRCGLASGTDIVTPERIQVAKVKPTIGNHWIGPRLGALAWRALRWSEAALLAISFWRRLDERDLALFTLNVDSALSVANGTRSDAFLLPLYI